MKFHSFWEQFCYFWLVRIVESSYIVFRLVGKLRSNPLIKQNPISFCSKCGHCIWISRFVTLCLFTKPWFFRFLQKFRIALLISFVLINIVKRKLRTCFSTVMKCDAVWQQKFAWLARGPPRACFHIYILCVVHINIRVYLGQPPGQNGRVTSELCC